MAFRTQLDTALEQRGYSLDVSQQAAVDRLQRLYEDWAAYKAHRSNALKKLLVRPPVPRGVYLWGDVGRGKSFLMDAFFATVPLLNCTDSRALRTRSTRSRAVSRSGIDSSASTSSTSRTSLTQ